MESEIKAPVSIGNIAYLNGNPPQDALESFAKQMAGDADVEAAIAIFCEILLEHGRPGNNKHVIVEYGPRIADHLTAGAFLKRAPWQSWHNSPRLPIYEMHGEGSLGWCAEVCDGVMLHVRFHGQDGLSSKEMACLLSESQHPATELVIWLEQLIAEDYSFDFGDVLNEMPEALRQFLGYNFRFGSRRISMWLGGDGNEARFLVNERDRNLEHALRM